MSIIFVLLPLSLLLALLGLAAFIWCVRRDQYRDLTGDAQRMLFDDSLSGNSGRTSSNEECRADSTIPALRR